MNPSKGEYSHCVIIPSYNSGPLLEQTVRAALGFWKPVLVVIDGSTDESSHGLHALVESESEIYMFRHTKNLGKGEAVLTAMKFAAEMGFTHAAVFDSDGQHEPSDLPRFIKASLLYPEAMILGEPLFGTEAPALRVQGRRVGNWWTHLETLWGGINDSLFGFRVYPIQPSLEILESIRGGRGFDFDTQLAVRLYWKGIPPINLPSRVHYKLRDDGGVTHFRYIRDNVLLTLVHAQLTLRAITLIPRLLKLRKRAPLVFP